MKQRNTNQKIGRFKHLKLSVAVTAALLSGYGSRQAYAVAVAGKCTDSGGTYVCSGAASGTGADLTETLTGNPLTVTTTAGFGIDTSGNASANAFTLSTTGTTLTFTDNNSSSITGGAYGIRADNTSTGGNQHYQHRHSNRDIK